MSESRTPRSEPPLDKPYYGAPWWEAMRRSFVKFAVFRGRASRSEFWWWQLTYVVGAIAFGVLSTLSTGGRDLQDRLDPALFADPWNVASNILQLVLIVPWLALGWRRMHDIDRSGAWTLFVMVPLAGPIVYAIMAATGPRPGGARYDG